MNKFAYFNGGFMWHRIGNKGVGLMAALAKHVVVLLAFAFPMMPIAMADDTYPNKPIRIIVPFTPGGSPDILARAVGQKITESTGVAVVVENVPGAGGTIGADRVAKVSVDLPTLPPDG